MLITAIGRRKQTRVTAKRPLLGVTTGKDGEYHFAIGERKFSMTILNLQ